MYSYSFFIIPLLILLFISICTLTSSIMAFKAQRNWASVCMLVSSSSFILLMVYGITASFLYSSRRIGMDSRSFQAFMEVMVYILPVLFVIGLIGFFASSHSIYRNKERLSAENAILKNKINNSH